MLKLSTVILLQTNTIYFSVASLSGYFTYRHLNVHASVSVGTCFIMRLHEELNWNTPKSQEKKKRKHWVRLLLRILSSHLEKFILKTVLKTSLWVNPNAGHLAFLKDNNYFSMYTFTVSLNTINIFFKCLNSFSKHKMFSL